MLKGWACNFVTDLNYRLKLQKLNFAAVKKILAFIMASLVLSLSMVPCADGSPFSGKEDLKYEISKSTSHDENHVDGCSPFCICTCCAGFSVTHTSTVLTVVTFPYQTIHSSFIEARTHSISFPIWQPPQLV